MNIIRTSLLFFTFLFFNCFLFGQIDKDNVGQFDKDNDGGDSTRANSSDEFECTKYFEKLPLPADGDDLQKFLKSAMFPLFSTPGTTFIIPEFTPADFIALSDGISNNNQILDEFDLLIGTTSEVTFALGLDDMDVECKEIGSLKEPNGPYKITLCVDFIDQAQAPSISLVENNVTTPLQMNKHIETISKSELGKFVSSVKVQHNQDWNGFTKVLIFYEDLEQGNENCASGCQPNDVGFVRIFNLIKNGEDS